MLFQAESQEEVLKLILKAVEMSGNKNVVQVEVML